MASSKKEKKKKRERDKKRKKKRKGRLQDLRGGNARCDPHRLARPSGWAADCVSRALVVFFVHVRVTNGNQGVLGLQLPLHPSGCCRCYLREPPLSVSVEGRWDNGRYFSSLTSVTKLLCLVTVQCICCAELWGKVVFAQVQSRSARGLAVPRERGHGALAWGFLLGGCLLDRDLRRRAGQTAVVRQSWNLLCTAGRCLRCIQFAPT